MTTKNSPIGVMISGIVNISRKLKDTSDEIAFRIPSPIVLKTNVIGKKPINDA